MCQPCLYLGSSTKYQVGSESASLTNGSGSCYFRQWPSGWQLRFICLLLFWNHIIFQGKTVIKNSESSRNLGFSHYFCLMIEGFGVASESIWFWTRKNRPVRGEKSDLSEWRVGKGMVVGVPRAWVSLVLVTGSKCPTRSRCSVISFLNKKGQNDLI